jgi:hypothetical protein
MHKPLIFQCFVAAVWKWRKCAMAVDASARLHFRNWRISKL